MSSSFAESSSFVLADVCIFTGDSFIEHGYVFVQNGIIAEVGPGRFPESLPALQVISRPNHTVIPGLIDSHTHALNGNVLAIEQPLRFGVTTVCDMHNEANHIAQLQKV
jgi:cytosine/adenosine deaminase-related metal-dependent hydrolase